MSEFVLQPAKVREGKFVPDRKASLLKFDWRELVGRLSPQKTRRGLMILKTVHPGMYVGTRNVAGVPTTFTFNASGRSRSAAHVLKQDPTFEKSLIEVFLVKHTNWDMRLQEMGAV